MRPCAFPVGYLGCGYYALTHPTLCYHHWKRAEGVYEPEWPKTNRHAERSVVVNDETEALVRTLAALGATKLQVLVALRQVNHGRETLRGLTRGSTLRVGER